MVDLTSLPCQEEYERVKRGVQGGVATRPVFIHTNTGQRSALVSRVVTANQHRRRDVVKQLSSIIRYSITSLDRLVLKDFQGNQLFL
jgi:hypothetical protein